ncbi:MAG: glycosyltransferase [Caldilineaceae bacterium]
MRPYQIIRALRRAGHTMTLATLWTSADELADLETLRQLDVEVIAHPLSTGRTVWNSLTALAGTSPIQASFCWQSAMARTLSALVTSRQFDAIHVEHLRGARYGLHVQSVLTREQGYNRPPVVWDSVDCISHLFAQAAQQSRSVKGRLMTGLELGRTRRYEGQLVRQFDYVLATSPTDAQALDALAGVSDKVQVLPNGVDLDYFVPASPAPTAANERPILVFSGKMSYHANVTAALHLVQDIMPLVWAQRPDVQVQLVGKDPAVALRNLANLHFGADGAPRVIVTGTVADLRPYLQQADLAVAPVPYGAGIQNKVLEAMACAAPVVASVQAASGLHGQGRDVVRVADGAADFAQAILALLADAPCRQQLGRAGRRYVEQWHSWDAVGAALEAVYAQSGQGIMNVKQLKGIHFPAPQE